MNFNLFIQDVFVLSHKYIPTRLLGLRYKIHTFNLSETLLNDVMLQGDLMPYERLYISELLSSASRIAASLGYDTISPDMKIRLMGTEESFKKQGDFFGVNLVIQALLGSIKADKAPALMNQLEPHWKTGEYPDLWQDVPVLEVYEINEEEFITNLINHLRYFVLQTVLNKKEAKDAKQ